MMKFLSKKNYARFVLFIVLLTGMGVSFTAFKVSQSWQTHRYRQGLERSIENFTASLNTELAGLKIAVSSIRFFFLSSDEVTSEEFHTFVQPYLVTFEGSLTLVWIFPVTREERPFFEEQMQKIIPGYEIREYDSSGKIVRASERSICHPIVFGKSLSGENDMAGMDISRFPEALQTISQFSAKSDIPFLSGPLPLINKGEPLTGALMVIPIQMATKLQGHDAVHRSQSTSFAGAVFSIQGLFNKVISGLSLLPIDVTIHDMTGRVGNEPGELLFRHRHASSDLFRDSLPNEKDSPFFSKREIEIGGRRWMITAFPASAFFEENRFLHPAWILAGGILITFLIAFNFFILVQRQSSVEKLVEERTFALSESERKFKLIAENIREVFFLYSRAQKTFAYISPGVEKIWGRSPDYFMKHGTDAWLASIHPDDRENVFDLRLKIIKEMSPFQLEYRILKPDGEVVWVYEQSEPILDEQGTMTMIAGICLDITARKLAEQEKDHFENQYRQAQKMEAMGRLAGGVAHDLNNLLSPILGYSELLLENPGLNDTDKDFLDQIRRAGIRARDLIRQLLAFSRKQALSYKSINLNEVIAGFEKLLRRTIREDITLKIIPSADLKPIMADIGQIEQVIMNLSVNGADAMPEGGTLTIETRMSDLDAESPPIHLEEKPDPYVLLTISDTGCGMNEETRERMFDPFFSTKGDLGTGLGLATVHGIVIQHGGVIRVESAPSKGTTFRIYLPLSDKVLAEDEMLPKEIQNLTGSETILLVEDNEQVRTLVQTILKKNGYTVIAAENGTDALDLLNAYHGPVHLLLTDVIMPKMNGKKLYQKATAIRPELKVLYMSGYTDNVISDPEIIDHHVQLIQKPFTAQSLATRVKEVLIT